MRDFMLITVDEREIGVAYFETQADAYNAMIEALAKAIRDKYDEEDRGDEWDYHDENAWANDILGHNYDWRIIDLSNREFE